MVLRDALKRLTGRTREHEQPYECGVCGLTFKRRRVNCPACGNTSVKRR
ncbi:hypothetical protein [Salarchaeum sp. JOR-1]|nr:hypothetical protein [Salarchaeum sp. JOR-1]